MQIRSTLIGSEFDVDRISIIVVFVDEPKLT